MFPVIIERLRGTVPRIESFVKNVDDNILSNKKNNDWSIKEQVGHLYDLEDLWYGRIEDFLAHREVLRAADMTNNKTNIADHNSKSITELILQFSTARNKLITAVAKLPERKVCDTSLHPRLQIPMRLIDSLFFVAEHDDHHLTRIRSLLL